VANLMIAVRMGDARCGTEPELGREGLAPTPRLLDQANVINQLMEAAGCDPRGTPVTEREARILRLDQLCSPGPGPKIET